MSADRVVLGSLDLDDLLVIVRSDSTPLGDAAITTTRAVEAAVLDRFVSRAGTRTVLLDDASTVSDELGPATTGGDRPG